MLSVATVPLQAVGENVTSSLILGCCTSNQPNLFHTVVISLRAGPRLCLLPLPAAAVTDKGTTLWENMWEFRTG